MVDWPFNVVTTMECSKQRLCWRSSLLLLCVGWNWQSLQVETMVRLSGATLGGVDEAPSVNDVLKPEAAKKSAVKARHMTSKDDDAQIQRDIKERFPEFTHVDCFVRLIDGKCLLDHIKLKKAACKAEGKRIATAWWQATRVKWSRATSPDSALVVKNAGDSVPQALVGALTTACSSNTRVRSSVPLIGWLQTQVAPPSQKALIGVFRHSLSMHPSTRHLQTVIGIMKLVAKLKLVTVYSTECAAMVGHWDCALSQWLSQASRSGLKDDVWMDNHGDCTTLVCNALHVEKVKNAKDVKECSEELRCLCASSMLGQRVYGACLAQLCEAEYLEGLDLIIAKTLADDIDEEKLARFWPRLRSWQ